MEMTLSRLGIGNIKSLIGGFGDDGITASGLSAGYIFCVKYSIVLIDPYGGHAYTQATRIFQFSNPFTYCHCPEAWSERGLYTDHPRQWP